MGVNWYLLDSMNSVRDIQGTQDIGVHHFSYSSFGTDLTPPEIRSLERYGFMGREHSVDGEIYFRQRFYMPSTGKFSSFDPLGFETLEFNLFRFVLNTPTLLRDPYGLVSMAEYSDLSSRLSVVASNCLKNVVAGEVVGAAVQLALYLYLSSNGLPYIGRTVRERDVRIAEHVRN